MGTMGKVGGETNDPVTKMERREIGKKKVNTGRRENDCLGREI